MISDTIHNIQSYLEHLDARIQHSPDFVKQAFAQSVEDMQFHFPDFSAEATAERITRNASEAAVYLYRLGRLYYQDGSEEKISQMHGLLRFACACEVYFSTEINVGLHLVHSAGTIIGSRNTIGKGFIAYQNCTIGHDHDDQAGAVIGDMVTLMPYSSIIGDVKIGNNVVVGAYTLVKDDVPGDSVIAGLPGKIVERGAQDVNRRIRPNLR
jgi:serine O-acetyltransferase